MKVFQEPSKQFFLSCQYPLIQIAQSNFFENSILAIWTKFYLYSSFKNWQVFQEKPDVLTENTVWRMKKIASSPLMVSSLSGQQDCVNKIKTNGDCYEKIWDGMERVTNLLNLEFFIKMATLHENPRFHV